MTTTIKAEQPDSPEATLLIGELEAHLAPQYPEESRHGYSVEKLLREKVLFYVIRHDGEAAGCGGIQIFESEYAEIKRMYVRPQFRGQGLGKLMLDHLAEAARQNDVVVLRLETGIYQAEAIGLYQRCDFVPIPPFGEYREDPLSVFYEKRIASE